MLALGAIFALLAAPAGGSIISPATAEARATSVQVRALAGGSIASPADAGASTSAHAPATAAQPRAASAQPRAASPQPRATAAQARAAAAARCLGKPARSLRRPGTHRIGRREAVIVNAPVRIIAKGDNRICTGRGDHPANITLGKGGRNLLKLGAGDDTIRVQGPTRLTRIDAGDGDNRIFINSKARKHVIKAGSGNDRVVARAKATSYSISTGAGNDTVRVQPKAKAASRSIATGLGDDTVVIRAKGNTNALLGAKSNPDGRLDNDYYSGGPSNDIVETYGGFNTIHGNNGADTLRSLGVARSTVYGGNGSDRIHSTGGDVLYGNRGNDRIEANHGASIGGVIAVGGAGDDWLHGTDADDILIGSTGIDKFKGFGGNDLFRADDGVNTIEGGGGVNTVSFAAHTPPGYRQRTGVFVDLAAGVARGSSVTNMSQIQNVIGSSFDDIIRTDPRHPAEVWGGLGNDEIAAHRHDRVHPGQQITDGRQPALSLSPDGVLTVLGSSGDDNIGLGRRADGTYTIRSSQPLQSVAQDCSVSGGQAECKVPELLNILVYGGNGNDAIKVEDSIPASVSTVLDGGSGNNVISGGVTSDYIYTGRGSSILEGGGGDDVIKVSDTHPTVVRAGVGHDLIRVSNPCLGHQLSGGPGKDNVVFAGSPRGVEANFTRNHARWRNFPNCTPSRLADLESAEGSRHNDLFIGSPRRGVSFLGRDGIDTFMTKNGRRDAITTGPGGRRNKIVADRFDRITYGWGFAAF